MPYFHIWLQSSLKKKNMKAATLARTISLSKGTVSLWLSNQRQPDYNNLVRVIDIFAASKSAKQTALYEIFYGQPEKKSGGINSPTRYNHA